MSIKTFLHSFIPPGQLNEDQDILRRQKLFVDINFLTAIFAFFYFVFSCIIDFQTGIYAMIFSVLFFASQPYLLKSGVAMHSLGIIVGIYIILLNGVLVYFSGGLFVSPVSAFITMAAPIILIFSGFRTALIATCVSVLYVLVFSILKTTDYHFPFTYDEKYQPVFLTIAFSGLIVIFFLITNTFERTKNYALRKLVEKQEELKMEQQKSEDLLLNIFPANIAQELKTTGKTDAKLHENVTILFADILNFTLIAEKLSPSQLVEELDHCFRKFDEIMGKNKLEKIKTIGDAYLAAAGVPATNTASASDMIYAALQMQQFAGERKIKNMENNSAYFEFRIGLHTGPVIAGVVGERKFVYDIWGDTVNLAARMQQCGEEGKINISEDTYQLVKGQFECRYRGKIEAKNKGEMDMYFVENIKTVQPL